VLDSLKTSFGKQELNGQARIYKDAETMKMTEPSYLIERSNAPESDKGAEEA
jgi:small subunit ribosomal protein S24e